MMTLKRKTRTRVPGSWLERAARLLCCGLMFVAGYQLVSVSTFALRLRNDVPPFVPGLDGPQSIAFVLSLVLSTIPLLVGRRALGAMVVSAFILSGIGAYWWTTIPWDELITESDFPTAARPRLVDYLSVAGPVLATILYAMLQRVGRLRVDHKDRGVDADESRRAAAASFLSGAAMLVGSILLAGVLWLLLQQGHLAKAQGYVPTGFAGILVAAAGCTLAWALASPRVRFPRPKLKLRLPSPAGAGRAILARIRGRKLPS